MKFLTKLGQIVLKVTEIVAGFGPAIQQMVPGSGPVVQTVSRDLAEIANVVAQAEVFGQALSLPGAQKLAGSAPAVAQIVLQSSILANHQIANAALFQQGCTKIADGMADVLNSLKDNVQSTSKAA